MAWFQPLTPEVRWRTFRMGTQRYTPPSRLEKPSATDRMNHRVVASKQRPGPVHRCSTCSQCLGVGSCMCTDGGVTQDVRKQKPLYLAIHLRPLRGLNAKRLAAAEQEREELHSCQLSVDGPTIPAPSFFYREVAVGCLCETCPPDTPQRERERERESNHFIKNIQTNSL